MRPCRKKRSHGFFFLVSFSNTHVWRHSLYTLWHILIYFPGTCSCLGAFNKFFVCMRRLQHSLWETDRQTDRQSLVMMVRKTGYLSVHIFALFLTRAIKNPPNTTIQLTLVPKPVPPSWLVICVLWRPWLCFLHHPHCGNHCFLICLRKLSFWFSIPHLSEIITFFLYVPGTFYLM